jgi:nucleoside-diphosphate-sugar epimerase
MKVFMIGGTGLLGSEGAKELIRRGHKVSSLSLPPIPEGANLPEEMEIKLGNYMDLTDEELRGHMNGCEGFVFAAGVDERVEGSPPIYELFKKYNITPLERMLRIAKECGVKRTVICGSYFSHFAKIWPKMQLTKWHPYIRSRIDQEEMALAFADEGFSVAILELPYIFGAQPGREPVWLFLVEMIRGMEKKTMYPKGGTTMTTVKQIAQTIAGALELTEGAVAYPIGYYNLTWVEFLKIVHKYMGCPDKKITTIPKWLYKLGSKQMMKKHAASGKEPGLHIVKFADVMCSEAFIDKSLGCDLLGVEPDDIDAAIGESILLCMDILDGKVVNAVKMKGE